MKQAKLNNGFSPELLGRIKSAIRRTGAEIWDDADALRYLDRCGAMAAYIADGKGTGTFAFRENPTRSDVFEELIHQAQDRRRRNPDWGYGTRNCSGGKINPKP
ncbi:hypothetical protein HYR99_06320 [Candidatus Poribacteria bacterium]|nr:hypothetical protein [Candidatus Poribacteria bacterium]